MTATRPLRPSSRGASSAAWMLGVIIITGVASSTPAPSAPPARPSADVRLELRAIAVELDRLERLQEAGP